MLPTALLAALLAAPPTVPSAGDLTHEPQTPHIYGGEEVEPGAWPATVAVRTGKLCTGTLVAPDLVLTAAHCFDPAPTVPIQIVFGDNLQDGEVMLSNEWGSHPEFCPPPTCTTDIHDFAWVRLPMAVSVEPILPITDQAEYDDLIGYGAPVTMVGFGHDEQMVLGIKREVSVSITTFSESGREFEAGGEGKDTCVGDSGGPAFVQAADGSYRLAGVTSRGGQCGNGGIYGVPFPELCWLRDDSGVDLLPPDCQACDCVDVVVPLPKEGCDCHTSDPRRTSLELGASSLLLCVLGLRTLVRRRRRLTVARTDS